MFYSVQLLAKKGPLGTVWIAGHLDKRLKRNQIYETNIASSVDSIINPEAPLALRLSGQLLLGVVRIYSRKITYLYSDCNEALVKIKQAFKAADVDLPNDGNIAPMHAITLPDNFNTLDFGVNAPNFLELNDEDAGIGISYGRRSSFVLADDLNNFFGSQRSMEEEQFEVAGEELQRHFSMDKGLTPERLRAAPAGEHYQPQPLNELFEGSPRISTGAPPEDELLAPPPDDLMLGMDDTPVAPPSEPLAGPSPAGSHGLPALSDLGNLSVPGSSLRGSPLEAQEKSTADKQQPSAAKSGRPPRPARQALKITKKLRPAKQDCTTGNKPMTELPKSEIMGLLKDPTALIKVRNNASSLSHARRVPDTFHVTRQSDLAQESMLHWPAVSARMAPQLFSLYTDAMSTKEERSATRHAQAPAERRAIPATVRADAAAGQDAEAISRTGATEEATAAGVRADEIAAAEAAEPETALEMMPATDIAEPPAGPMDVDTAGPDAMYQHDDFAAGQEPAMLDGHEEGLSTGGPASSGGPRSNMATPPFTDGHPMPSSTDQASELQSWGSDGHAKDSFTNRTKLVLDHLQTNFGAAQSGSVAKKRRLSSGSPYNMPPQVSMNALVEGKSRRDASRWFFEMLVLKTRNYVNLTQEEPYADISISATSKLLTMS